MRLRALGPVLPPRPPEFLPGLLPARAPPRDTDADRRLEDPVASLSLVMMMSMDGLLVS